MKSKLFKSTLLLILVSLVSFFIVSTNLISFGKDDSAIQIKGSDTMVNLVSKLAEDYMKKFPNDNISVTGGGSGTGISALLNGTIQFATSSRDIKESELKIAKERGINVVDYPIAYDALTIIVHNDNRVKELTLDQIGKIFKGEITNWKEVGGKDATIVMHGRQPNSGTYDFLREHVVKADYAKNVSQQNGNSAIVANVKLDDNAIGYIGAAYLKEAGNEIKAVKVKKDSSSKAYSPEDSTAIYSKNYPITRVLHIYSNGKPKDSSLRFLLFCYKEGQKIVNEFGFYSIKKEL